MHRRPTPIRPPWLLVLALAFVPSTRAVAAAFYVDCSNPLASDVNPGTPAAPYRSVNAAIFAHGAPGDTIVVEPGVYREQVGVNVSGASGNPFVIEAGGPGTVVDAADDFGVSGAWASVVGGVWLAPSVTWNPLQVFADGARLAPATLAPAALAPGSFEYVAGAGLYVNVDGDPSLHQLLVGRRAYGVAGTSRSFVTVRGFTVLHAENRGIDLSNGIGCVVAGNRVQFARFQGIHLGGGSADEVAGNVVSDCGDHGIYLSGGVTGSVVRDNESYANARPAVRAANGIHLFGSPGNRVERNRAHDNQDTGIQINSGSDNTVCLENLSWNNGDHGFDHLHSTGTTHIGDVAYHNFKDGFSIEGSASGTRLYDCIAIENGLTTNEFDLWVDDSSFVGFRSDYNMFWNSTPQPPVKIAATLYSTVTGYAAATGQDHRSLQADPRFASPQAGDFHLRAGSPAIDAAITSVAEWPALDADGHARFDDPATKNTGTGAVPYADRGALEYFGTGVSGNRAPVVSAPGTVKTRNGVLLSFDVTASDPDNTAILSLVADLSKTPGATFTVNANHTRGTFAWTPSVAAHDSKVVFTAANDRTGTATTTIQVQKAKAAVLEPLPLALRLSEVRPNPATGPIELALDLPEPAPVDWMVLDLAGRAMWREHQELDAGRHTLRWSGAGARRLRPGLYLIRVDAGTTRFTRRVVWL